MTIKSLFFVVLLVGVFASIGCGSSDGATDVKQIQADAKAQVPKDVKPLDPSQLPADLKTKGKS